ncbi:MAG: hypothetical protein NTV61_09835 [Candidatus Bathyarchaeota archaeon]|nr:hypothetical protein [Candidatus Bathyarchaeota archaeon]
MKPWLLNLLACPIDKHHPLEAYFFRWETKTEDIDRVAAEAGKPKKELEDKYRILKKQLGDGTISPPAIAAIKDLTGSKAAASLHAKAEKLLQGKPEKKEDIDTLYSYMNTLELGEGLLFCHECNRWYPIGSAVEGIPELMPDELREPEKDLEWLKKWKKVTPEGVLSGGKPFKPE